jgi:hypothetical protein
VEIFNDGSDMALKIASSTMDDGHVNLPIHPLEESRWPDEKLTSSGFISISASYRTVFFQPEPGGLLSDALTDNHNLMIKLHLEVPLPGIAVLSAQAMAGSINRNSQVTW